MTRLLPTIFGLAAFAATNLFGASFIVPSDRDFARRAPAIAVGSAIASHTQLNSLGGIETVTNFSIEEAIKGSFDGDSIDIVEPGGIYNDRATVFAGAPRFRDGDRYLLFLIRSDDGRWHVLDLTLGKFHFATDTLGHDVVLRDMHDVAAFATDGSVHRDPIRAAGPFLDFVRTIAHGGPAKESYTIAAEPLIAAPGPAPRLQPQTLATYTAESYTMDLGGGIGGRWLTFPVVFTSVGSEPGAPGNGTTAITTAFNAWDTAPGASINYQYGGSDPTATAATVNAPNSKGDGKNTITFEYNLSTCCGIPAFSCSSNSYGGTLGLGGVSNTAPTNQLNTTPDGSQFYQTLEGDVWMNQGIANCTLLLTTHVGDWNSAVTHETGHTLGFRHADQNRADNGACGTDAIAEECATSAIMTANVTSNLNATLQPWDQHAASLVYPGSAATPAAPTGVVATATSPTNVQVTWSGNCSTQCHVYRSGDHVNYTLVGSPTASPFNDSTVAANTSYLYKVRASTATVESPDSNIDLATTVIFTDDPLQPGVTVIKAVHLAELRTAVNAVRKLAGLAPATFTYSGAAGTVVHAQDINELRTALDQAMSVIGFPTGGYTNAIVAGSVIRAVDLQEIRNRVK